MYFADSPRFYFIFADFTVTFVLLYILLFFYDSPCRYYRGTHGVIVVYDVCNGESFANVKRWLHEIDQNCDAVNRILGL